MTLEKSLADLMEEALSLSWKLSYSTIAPDGTYFDPREDSTISDNDWTIISGWADGLMHKYQQNCMAGHCSLNEMINFDLEKFESEVIRDIENMKVLLARVGEPKRLTREDLIKRGYVV
jgi:hypothetical protein